MKKWKDGKDRYGLLINDQEVGALHYYSLFGYGFTAYINGETWDTAIHTDNLEDAKIEAEQWLADLYEKHIAMLEESIRIHKQYIGLLNNTKKGG